MSSKFCDFAVFSSSRLRDPILDAPGLRFGSLLAPGLAETSLLGGLGPSKGRFAITFFGSGGLQERSERLPRGLQAAKTAPRALQEASGSILEQFWSHLGTILESFWKHFWTSLGVAVCSYLNFKETEKEGNENQQSR